MKRAGSGEISRTSVNGAITVLTNNCVGDKSSQTSLTERDERAEPASHGGAAPFRAAPRGTSVASGHGSRV